MKLFLTVLALVALAIPSIAGARCPYEIDTVRTIDTAQGFGARWSTPFNAVALQFLVTYWEDPERGLSLTQEAITISGPDLDLPLAKITQWDLDPIVGRCFTVNFRFLDENGVGLSAPNPTDSDPNNGNFSTFSLTGMTIVTGPGDLANQWADGIVGLPDLQCFYSAYGKEVPNGYYTGARRNSYTLPPTILTDCSGNYPALNASPSLGDPPEDPVAEQ